MDQILLVRLSLRDGRVYFNLCIAEGLGGSNAFEKPGSTL